MIRRSQAPSPSGGSVKAVVALLMLIPVLGFGAFAYLRSAENEQIRAENERKLQEQAAVEAALTSIPDASIDPFQGLDFSGFPRPPAPVDPRGLALRASRARFGCARTRAGPAR